MPEPRALASNDVSGPLPPLVLLLFCWTVVAIVAATTSFIGLGGSTITEWAVIAGYMFAFFYAWIPISLSVFVLVRYFERRDMHWTTQLMLHFAYLVVLTVALAIVVHPLTWQVWLYGQKAIGFHALNAFMYSTVVLCSLAVNHYAQVRDQERRQLALERALDQSRLQALRAQMNPHFLFNTLNSIASLVHSASNERAYEVLEMLASLLRYVLDASRDSVVTLAEELEFLADYVNVEQLRYGKKLDFSTDVSPACVEHRVPALSLQPLVENAIKHAVAVSTRTVHVTLKAQQSGDLLRVQVSDDGPGLGSGGGFRDGGVGLANVRERLGYMFGDRASLELSGNHLGGVTVEMILPAGEKESRRLAKKQFIAAQSVR